MTTRRAFLSAAAGVIAASSVESNLFFASYREGRRL